MEELSDLMDKYTKIKEIIHAFKNDLCPKCTKKLDIHFVANKRSQYTCKGCGLYFWENQFYEIYFDEIIRVMTDD